MATAKSIVFQNSTDQLDGLLLELCEELQLKKTRYDLAADRYGTITDFSKTRGARSNFSFHGFSRRVPWHSERLANQLRARTISTSFFKSLYLIGGGTRSPGWKRYISF
jgi:hypothetical protein